MDTRNNIIHQRPVGIYILSCLQFFNSVIGLSMSLFIIFFTNAFVQWIMENGKLYVSEQQIPLITTAATIIGVIILVTSLFRLLLAYGLFTLKGWAWITTLIFNGLSIIANFYLIFQQKSGSHVFLVVIDAVIIYYLLRPSVKRAFGKG